LIFILIRNRTVYIIFHLYVKNIFKKICAYKIKLNKNKGKKTLRINQIKRTIANNTVHNININNINMFYYIIKS